MRVQFYDNPIREPLPRDKVSFNKIGLYMFEDGRRFSIGFDITPFVERPSIQIFVVDPSGNEVTSMTVVETNQSNFSFTMHLPDDQGQQDLDVTAVLFYVEPDGSRLIVNKNTSKLNPMIIGEQ